MAEEDRSSGDDSEYANYEFVARKKPSGSTAASSSTPIVESASERSSIDSAPSAKIQKKFPPKSSLEETFSNEDTTLAQILESLKQGKATPSASTGHQSDDEPDAEMMEEFATVKAHLEESSSDKSADIGEEEDSVEISSMDADDEPLEKEDVSAAEASVAVGIVNTTNNTVDEDYDIDAAHSLMFYFGDAAVVWPLFTHRGLLDERNIDVRSYDRYNIVDFLKLRQLYSTVVVVIPYCKRVILEFYANLTSSIEDPKSSKYGLVYLRG
ncbi:uncharacterized protein [Henckelia pumila]|uniref:uncharacterized protein isoform X2 n=1 Tax=Henckelia pumila TaxID=405737 RepID=UPI003C6E5A97